VIERVTLDLRSRKGDAIRLVPLSTSHAPAMLEAILESGADLRRWMAWWNEGFRLEEAEAFARFCERGWSEGSHDEFAIRDDDCDYLGSCALSGVNADTSNANLSYWIRSGSTGAANVASRRVAERAGAQAEGVLRDWVRVARRSYNFARYAFSPEDFHADEM
jgi:RimJ/RimL family protein N-acetyltransferase